MCYNFAIDHQIGKYLLALLRMHLLHCELADMKKEHSV